MIKKTSAHALSLALFGALALQGGCLPAYDPDDTAFNGQGPGRVNCEAPAGEVCDGLDNDCDGQIDEDFPRRGVPCGINVGVCLGVTICEAGQESCAQVQAPEDEDCDGLDNDCDGLVDELTETDPNNCGACGAVCLVGGGQAGCRAGECVVEGCDAGFLDCDRDPVNGCETDASSDPTNCGACANICSAEFAESVCQNAQCVIQDCLGGRTDCNAAPLDGCEADLSVDTLNCGVCGMRCDFPNALARCQENLCVFDACLNGFGDRDVNPANGCEIGLQLLSSPPDPQLANLARGGNMLFGAADNRLIGYPLANDGAIGALAFSLQLAGQILQIDAAGPTVFAALAQGDIQIIDTRDPANPTAVGLVPTSGPSPGFAREEQILFVADGRDGLRVVNVGNSSEPIQIGRAPTPNTVNQAFLSGERLILNGAGRSDFHLFDVSDKANPDLIATFEAQGPFDQAVLSGDLLITGQSGQNTIRLYRQDAAQLTVLGQSSLPGPLVSMDLRFPFVMAVVRGPDGRVNFVLVDIRRPQQPTLANTFAAPVPNEASSAVVSGTQVIISGTSGLQRFEITDLRRPISLQDLVRPQDLRDIDVKGTRLFVAANGSVEILDNTDPQTPVRIARLGADFRNIHPTDTSLFVTSDAQGIVGYRLNGINDNTPPFIIIEGPRPSALLTDATGNIIYALRDSILETININGDINTRGFLELPGSCRAMIRHQSIIYLACNNGLVAVDPQTPPNSPVVVGQAGGGDLYAIELFGQTVYALTDSEIAAFTALSPGTVNHVGSVGLGISGLRHIAGAGPYMIVGSGAELRLIDRANLTNVVPVAIRTLEGAVVDAAASPNTFYAGTTQGVFRLNVEAP